MEFDQLVSEKIVPLFNTHDFIIAEKFKNYFHFRSTTIQAAIGHNELDKTNHFEIGKIDEFSYPLKGKLIKQIFGIDLKIDHVTKEIFVDNVSSFLKNEGAVLLKGDMPVIYEIKAFIEKESKIYTLQILLKQNLAAADRAWGQGNYTEFIKIIDSINKDDLSASYQLKYKIALRKA